MAGSNEPSQQRDNTRVSGNTGSGDPTAQPGQYPPSRTDIFGGSLPTGTGAPGTSGGGPRGDDTAEPGQMSGGVTGVSTEAITNTGSPGTSTSPNSRGGGTSVKYTRPGSPFSGTYQSDTTTEKVDGPGSGTEANQEGYATGGPQLPGIKGNEPEPGGQYQPGSGRVLRGGYTKGQR